MNDNDISNIILKEGRKKIKEIEERLDKLLEITKCVICNEEKPLSEFSEDKNGFLGYSNICQNCFDKVKLVTTQANQNMQLKCEKCGELKSVHCFHKIRRKGYYHYCIECTKSMIDEKAKTLGITKKCISCGQEMPASTEYYFVGITCKGLLRRRCKVCEQERKKEMIKIKKMVDVNSEM